MLTQVDYDGFTMTLMEWSIYHKVDLAKAISESDGYVTTQRGQKKLRITTCSWQLLVKWKDVSESWTHLKDLKELHPVELENMPSHAV